MTGRMLHLLGEVKRQMNGAVVGSMRFYGVDYGLNYGVSISTIRTLGRAESEDHTFAKYLYQQDIRELKLLALWCADPAQITSSEEHDFWATGVINSEIAEEAAFVLLSKVVDIAGWLWRDSEMLQYCALLALSSSHSVDLDALHQRLDSLLATSPSLLPKAVVALLGTQLNAGERSKVKEILSSMPENPAGDYITSELEWRLAL